jgi:hypothetical protein
MTVAYDESPTGAASCLEVGGKARRLLGGAGDVTWLTRVGEFCHGDSVTA